MSIWTDKNGRTHVGVMVAGQRVHRILPPDATARDAQRVEDDLKHALGAAGVRRRATPIPQDPPMAAVMALYIEHTRSLRSASTATFHALRAGPWAEKYRASQARECAAHMIRDMRGQYAPATINRSLGTMSKALSLAWERGLTIENYGLRIKRLPEHNLRDVTLTIEQVGAIAACASEQVRAAIWIALYTGCRRGEILSLRAQDIGEQSITLRAGSTKTLKTRVVPIVAPLRPWLVYVPLRINFEGLKTGFVRAREKAGLPQATFHDLRRSTATLMLNSGVELHVVSRLLGHSSTSVTEARYAHLKIDRVHEGLARAFGA